MLKEGSPDFVKRYWTARKSITKSVLSRDAMVLRLLGSFKAVVGKHFTPLNGEKRPCISLAFYW